MHRLMKHIFGMSVGTEKIFHRICIWFENRDEYFVFFFPQTKSICVNSIVHDVKITVLKSINGDGGGIVGNDDCANTHIYDTNDQKGHLIRIIWIVKCIFDWNNKALHCLLIVARFWIALAFSIRDFMRCKRC